jgi:hypothetical protein
VRGYHLQELYLFWEGWQVILFTGIFTVPSPPSHTIMPGEPFDKYAASDRDLIINSLGFRLIMGGAATIIVSAILHYRLINREEGFEAARIAPAAPAPRILQPIWNSAVLVAAKPALESAESTAITMPSTIEKTVSATATVPQAVSATVPVLPLSIGPSITSYPLTIYPRSQ